MAVLITNLSKLRCLLSLATGPLAQLTKDEDIFMKKHFLTFEKNVGGYIPSGPPSPPCYAVPVICPVIIGNMHSS